MQIQVYGQGVEIDDRLRSFVEEKLHGGLDHLEERLTRIELHLRDVNGHKNGIDKRCVCEARPRGMDPIAVEHDAESVSEAVTGAVGKLQRALQHRFERRNARR